MECSEDGTRRAREMSALVGTALRTWGPRQVSVAIAAEAVACPLPAVGRRAVTAP